MVEIDRKGGVVTDGLIGNRWIQPRALAGRVRAMLEG
jgi:hypothetical protein